MRVVLGRMDCELFERIFEELAVKGISSAGWGDLLLELGIVSNICGLD